ncbi:MAG: hypothetical protein LUH14_04760 [Clostridiaceae bacterium]|nr:hypothetical protein [Clostridiaceae bacterium]
MGKMNELSLLLDEMIEAGNKMVETAEALKEYFSAAPTEPEHKKPVKEKAPEPEPKPEAKPQRSKSDIRALLVEKSNAAEGKYKPQVKALVKKYADGGTFSDIKPESYEALAAELEVIGDA